MEQTAVNLDVRRGLELFLAGKLADAEQACLDVLQAQSYHFGALNLLGIIAAQTQRPELAVELIGKAIALRPDSAQAYNNRGNVLELLGRFEESLADFDRAIALAPNLADTYANRAAILRNLGRPEEALASCDEAIRLAPDAAEAHNNRGSTLHDLGRFQEALSSFDRAIALKQDLLQAHTNRGSVLRDLGRLDDALACCDAVIAVQPNLANGHNSRGNALRDLGRFAEALTSYDAAIALEPALAVAHANRGSVMSDLGHFEDALASYEKAIALNPEFTETYKNQSMCYLAMGDYERGWETYEWRWHVRGAEPKHNLPGHPWLGDVPIAGKTILVHGEQGLGDSLQFCRYVPLLAADASVVLDVSRPLVRLLSGLKGVTRVVASGQPLPRFDAWIPMMSLPLVFATTIETIPAQIPYLHADQARSATWKQRFAALPGRKVGLVWAGSPRSENPRAPNADRRRSITLQHFAPLAAIPGLCLISLQKGGAAAQARTPPTGMTVHDWTGELDDFADTAALIEALDLVISVDTSVVHLAGALGKPVWVLNRYDRCWRWLRGRMDSPWYPTARLFTQASSGDWSSVIRDVAAALAAWQATGSGHA
jgi:tetratricopeptide (TPR) repeat protein